MDDLKYQILDYLYQVQNRQYSEYRLYMQLKRDIHTFDSAMDDLFKLKYITRTNNRDYCKLETHGAEAFESEKQRRDQETKQESKENAEKLAKMSLAKVQEKKNLRNNLLIAGISSVFSVLFALFVEHFPQILNTIASLFK